MRNLLQPLTKDEIARRDRESVEEDVAPWRGSTVSERVEAVRRLLHLATTSLKAGRGSDSNRREWQDPRSDEAEQLWLRLVREYRSR